MIDHGLYCIVFSSKTSNSTMISTVAIAGSNIPMNTSGIGV